MKKKLLILFSAILLLCLLLGGIFYYKAYKDYIEKFRRMEGMSYAKYETLYCSDSDLIDNVETLFGEMLREDPDTMGIGYRFCRDPFSSKDELLLFVPLYNRDNERESFLLLSAGIDGVQNTIPGDTDTLYVDDWWQRIETYNYEEQFHGTSSTGYIRTPDFNLKDYLFGEKDYIVIWGKNCP